MSSNKLSNADTKPTSFELAEFQKPKSGEDLIIDMSVVVEPLDGPMQKKATVSVNLPGWSDWEITCDEGTSGGGDDTAPAPLMFFSAGVAFCLMTHMQMAAKQLGLTLKTLRLEQRSQFASKFNFETMHPKDNFGSGKNFQTFVHVESDDAPELIEEFVSWCEQACMAGQSIANSVPTQTKIVLNGTEL
ncbi:MAG: OsmC family protein [Pseudomonadota bacterium]